MERDHSCLFPHSSEDACCDREVEDVGHRWGEEWCAFFQDKVREQGMCGGFVAGQMLQSAEYGEFRDRREVVHS